MYQTFIESFKLILENIWSKNNYTLHIRLESCVNYPVPEQSKQSKINMGIFKNTLTYTPSGLEVKSTANPSTTLHQVPIT